MSKITMPYDAYVVRDFHIAPDDARVNRSLYDEKLPFFKDVCEKAIARACERLQNHVVVAFENFRFEQHGKVDVATQSAVAAELKREVMAAGYTNVRLVNDVENQGSPGRQRLLPMLHFDIPRSHD